MGNSVGLAQLHSSQSAISSAPARSWCGFLCLSFLSEFSQACTPAEFSPRLALLSSMLLQGSLFIY